MKTELYRISPNNPLTAEDQNAIQNAGERIRNGELVVFPTETVYGLGGDATDATAAQKIYAAKGRPSDNPLIIHVAEPADAEKYAQVNETYRLLAKAFMPGPLTVILPKKECIPYSVTGGLDTVAVRCPSHPVARALIQAAGVPIAAPSANLSGKPSPTCAEHVLADMDGRVSVILDGGPSEIGLESTIVKTDNGFLTLLRPGGITYDALCMVVPDVRIAPAVKEQLKNDERPLSPGMKYKHYAPNTPVVLLDGSEDQVLSFLQQEQQTKNCVILCYNEEIPHLNPHGLLPVGAADDLSQQAHLLFHALRDADLFGAEIIYAHLPPQNGIGLALYNRLIRAAAHTIKKLE